MNKLEAVKLTRAELDKHGLTNVKVVLNGRLTRVFGRYRYSLLYTQDKSIELSTQIVEANSVERVTRTILHEVAHALTEGHGHDSIWKAKCLEIGGDGVSRYSIIDTNTPKGRQGSSKLYKLECNNCGYSGGRYRRRMNGYSHRGCGGNMTSVEI